MELGADIATILNRILDAAADNLTFAKLLVKLGLDPNNITYDALFNRLLELVVANINIASLCALIGAIFFVATLLTRTMVPLRVSNMVSNLSFAAYGALAGDIKTFLLYLLLFPINAVRLRQMLKLVEKARTATQGDMSMEWLKPFMTERRYRRGDVLFKKDEPANEMLLTVTKIPSQGDRRRAAPRKPDGRTGIPDAQQPAHRDHRMSRRRLRAVDHL